MSINENHESAKYVRISSRIRRGVEVKTSSTALSLTSDTSSNVAIMAEEHDSDWSGGLPHSFDNAEIVSLASGVFAEITPLLTDDRQLVENTTLSSAILAAYKKADTWAVASKISASLLAVLLQGKNVYVGSVGICKCFLISSGTIRQVNVDDYLRLEVDGKPFVATASLLSNTIGAGEIESLADIHFEHFTIDSHGLLLLCSGAFYQNVSENEMLGAALLSSSPRSLCASLAEVAIQRLSPSDPLALCALSVRSADNRNVAPEV